MARIKLSYNAQNIVKLYESGIGYYEVAKITVETVRNVRATLVSAGIDIRSQGEQLRLTQQRRGIEWRTANTNAAHDAVRGMSRTEEDRCKGAVTREVKLLGASQDETSLADWLRSRLPVEIVQQKAVGRYNIDIAIPAYSIAVEVFGGHWHLSGRHADRLPKRHKYIRDHGWLPVYIWATTAKPLSFACADYLIALCERASRGESLIGEKHVIWGNGQRITGGQFNLDHLA